MMRLLKIKFCKYCSSFFRYKPGELYIEDVTYFWREGEYAYTGQGIYTRCKHCGGELVARLLNE